MKSTLLTLALLTGLTASAFAAPIGNNKSGSNDGLLLSTSRSEAAAAMVYDGRGKTVRMNRTNCDLNKNGAAFLDACSPDGMAGGGGNHSSSK